MKPISALTHTTGLLIVLIFVCYQEDTTQLIISNIYMCRTIRRKKTETNDISVYVSLFIFLHTHADEVR